MERNLPHLVPTGTATPESFTSPRQGRSKRLIPERQPHSHGAHLIRQLSEIDRQQSPIRQRRLQRGLEAGGLVLEFESDPNADLIYKSLENESRNIELLNVRVQGDRVKAVVLVPDGELSFFVRRIEQYLLEPEQGRRRRNADLIESIANVRHAVLKALWTDSESLFPRDDTEVWWEIWIRRNGEHDDSVFTFRTVGEQNGMEVSRQQIDFVDRSVLLVRTRESVLQETFELIDVIAELRRARVSANEFIDVPPREQRAWVEELLERLMLPEQSSSAVALLDTGVNNGHPLLHPFLNDNDMHVFDGEWGTGDQRGHGTEMAGLVIFGDLIDVLGGSEKVEVPYRLESVKVLPPAGRQNDPQLYGHITEQSVAQLEIAHPNRARTFVLAITTDNAKDYGRPSSWSAAIDSVTSTDWSDEPKLFVVSVGNMAEFDPETYPEANDLAQVEDPAQAWNAISVGALTHKVWVDEDVYPNWRVVAPRGDLSPSSRTSAQWSSPWPYKPDVVMEGGNQVWNTESGDIDTPESLSLLTTYHQPSARLFTGSGDTSAATALVAKACARVAAQYPHFWPETIRALIVHSAEWNDQMIGRFRTSATTIDIEGLVRTFGYGEPDETRAMFSAANAATIIIQDDLQPYVREDGVLRTNEMHVHEIPWPTDELMSLEGKDVRVRVTLSYFVEPNPARRGWGVKHVYGSHGLRFDMKTPTESYEQFRRRINKAAREEDEASSSRFDSRYWALGQKRCNRGSLHSDIWIGSSVDLAEKGYVAVYPTKGWWCTRPSAGRWDRRARYSLALSLEAVGIDIDLYSAIEAKIKVPVEVTT